MITEILSEIQSELKAPKDLKNDFGGYKYRSAESILESLKPILKKHKAALTISDDVFAVGERVYVKALAKLSIGDESVQVSAYAREPMAKKGMDEAQITGATSSYARKYALNGLFAIDDTKDADATNKHDGSQDVINQDNINKYVKGTLERLEAEDGPAMLELWSELDEREQHYVWREFNSHQKKAIRELLQEARKAA